MADTFTIDFLTVSWSSSKASWEHANADAYAALKRTAQGEGERLVLLLPASANIYLEATVEIDSSRLWAEFRLTPGVPHGLTPEGLNDMNTGNFTKLLHGQAVIYSAPAKDVVHVAIDTTFTDRPHEKRLEHVLKTVYDLQTIAFLVRNRVFGISETASWDAVTSSLTQRLVAE